ncbi:hypothetical protein [Frankia sp. R43]|uniref:hypothetical protein n=1 Tax=Frankia sp. R43 TaxID=269536 RepID=UPI000AE76649|nr:hypothetical protein [Frankia sp. R43]
MSIIRSPGQGCRRSIGPAHRHTDHRQFPQPQPNPTPTVATAGPTVTAHEGCGAVQRNRPTRQTPARQCKPINYYLEKSPEADKVVDIFIRVNSGGTTLSHSDLLLTMATSLWTHLDAREEVRSLVEELNAGGGRRFDFSKDVALKTALMGAGGDIEFQVASFTPRRMATVERPVGGDEKRAPACRRSAAGLRFRRAYADRRQCDHSDRLLSATPRAEGQLPDVGGGRGGPRAGTKLGRPLAAEARRLGIGPGRAADPDPPDDQRSRR